VEVEERGKRALVIPHSPWLAPPALMVWANVVRVTFAFVYGVLLGICWECASMIVLLAATLLEHIAGTIFMMAVFVGLAGYAFSVAARADLARPLLSIFAFRLSAQVAMTIGTGSLLLTTMLSDTPACSSEGLRTSGWRGMVVALTKWLLPRRWLRRIVGVEPPYGPPFLRVLAAVASREWLGWVPNPFGLPSLLALPGSITFKPDRATTSALEAAVAEPRPIRLEQSVLESLIPVGYGSEELAGVYTYACKDQRWSDYYYIFRYPAFWYAPASMALLHSLLSLCVKMLLMHAYASIFMLLSQSNCREAFVAELERRVDRLRRWWRPRPPVRLIRSCPEISAPSATMSCYGPRRARATMTQKTHGRWCSRCSSSSSGSARRPPSAPASRLPPPPIDARRADSSVMPPPHRRRRAGCSASPRCMPPRASVAPHPLLRCPRPIRRSSRAS